MRAVRTLQLLSVVAAGAIGASCHDRVTGPRTEMAPAVADYIDSAFYFAWNWFYFHEQVDWLALREQTYARARGAARAGDAYPALDSMIKELRDRHSFFYEPARTAGTRDAPPGVTYYQAYGGSLSPRVGYLWIPQFTGTNQPGRADSIQRAIAKIDAMDDLCGWIVDLRGNPGGYWAPMLAGMSPLLGDGVVGGYVLRDPTQRYLYEVHPGGAGARLPNGFYFALVQLPESYAVRRPNLPIAVLQNATTASAGEILLMGLRRDPLRPRRTFGQDSYGATTQPFTKLLADSASVQVMAGFFFDKYEARFPEYVIAPDQRVDGPSFGSKYVPGSEKDAVVDSASAWLGRQAACSNPQGSQVGSLRSGAGDGTIAGTWTATRTVPGERPLSAWPRGLPVPARNGPPR